MDCNKLIPTARCVSAPCSIMKRDTRMTVMRSNRDQPAATKFRAAQSRVPARLGCLERIDFSPRPQASLIARCNFSRQYAELIDVPIANEHLDRGYHCLIVVASLGVASLLESQTFKLRLGCCIGIVSHDPSPSQCRMLTFAPNMAVSGHPLGAI
jgi:hypothetical protein